MQVPVYDQGGRIIQKVPLRGIEDWLVGRRAIVVRGRAGKIARVYVLGDSERALSASSYAGTRYSHDHECDHPNPAYQNIRGVWAFRYISRRDRPAFFSVINSVLA